MVDWLWFLAWGIATSVWCWTAAQELGATFDEPIYVRRGLEGWRNGSHQGLLQLGTMPLPVDVGTLPLYLWERWHGIRLDPVGDLEEILPWARAGTLVFWWLLLFYARLAGQQLAGPWGGRLAVATVACEPVLLAHASLATTDIAITACLLALVYHYRIGRDRSWFWRVAVPAIWFAAAMLAKASGLVFGLVCLSVVELEYLLSKGDGVAGLWSGAVARWGKGLYRQRPQYAGTQYSVLSTRCLTSAQRLEADESSTASAQFSSRLQPFRRDLAQIIAGGLLLTFLYCGSDWRADPSFVEWAHRLPDGTTSRALVWSAEHLRIFSNAGEGLVRQVKHNVRGHGTYLLGQMADRSIWYYFPVALTIKLSLPLLMLPLLLVVIRPQALANWACLAALALLALSVTYRVQIGVRLVLPLVALAAVGLAAAAVNAYGALTNRQGDKKTSPSVLLVSLSPCLLVSLLIGGVVWTASAALLVWPHALCYTNELWGGTRQGYLYLSDSNYDWGQGLRELAHWQRQHRDGSLDVWYFGSDPALGSLPMREIRFHTLVLRRPEEFLPLVRGHYLAVSTTLLYGSIKSLLRSDPAAAETFAQVSALLHSRRPMDRTTTFLIYDFTEGAERGPRTGQAQGAESRESLTKVP